MPNLKIKYKNHKITNKNDLIDKNKMFDSIALKVFVTYLSTILTNFTSFPFNMSLKVLKQNIPKPSWQTTPTQTGHKALRY